MDELDDIKDYSKIEVDISRSKDIELLRYKNLLISKNIQISLTNSEVENNLSEEDRKILCATQVLSDSNKLEDLLESDKKEKIKEKVLEDLAKIATCKVSIESYDGKKYISSDIIKPEISRLIIESKESPYQEEDQ